MESSCWRGVAMRERAPQRSRSIRCRRNKRRSCHWTFATKDIKTVFATRRYNPLLCNWSEKILLIDIDKTDNRQETPNHVLFSDRKYLIFVVEKKFRAFNFRISGGIRKYFNTEIFPIYGTYAYVHGVRSTCNMYIRYKS